MAITKREITKPVGLVQGQNRTVTWSDNLLPHQGAFVPREIPSLRFSGHVMEITTHTSHSYKTHSCNEILSNFITIEKFKFIFINKTINTFFDLQNLTVYISVSILCDACVTRIFLKFFLYYSLFLSCWSVIQSLDFSGTRILNTKELLFKARGWARLALFLELLKSFMFSMVVI